MTSQIIIGFVIVGFGFLIVRSANWFLHAFGRSAFFDRYLGAEGGTRLFYQLLGILVILFGFLYAFGILQRTVGALFRPFFRGL